MFAPMEAPGEPTLRLVSQLVVLGKQLGGLGIAARGGLQLGEDGRLSVADLAVQARELHQLLPWILLALHLLPVGAGGERSRLVIAPHGQLHRAAQEDVGLAAQARVHRGDGDSGLLRDRTDRRCGVAVADKEPRGRHDDAAARFSRLALAVRTVVTGGSRPAKPSLRIVNHIE